LLRRDDFDEDGTAAAPDDADGSSQGKPYFLMFAIYNGRTDLLPAILARPEDPNRRTRKDKETWGPSPVELAIAQ